MLDQSLSIFLSIQFIMPPKKNTKITRRALALTPFTNLSLQQQQYSATQHFTGYLNETASSYKEPSVK